MALRQDKMTPEAIRAKAAAKPAEGAIVPKVEQKYEFTPGVHTVKIGDASVVYQVFEDADRPVEIASVRVPQAKRGKGSAKAALQDIISAADKNGVPLRLVASPLDAKTSTAGLIDLYKKFGFKETGEKANPVGDPWMERSVKLENAGENEVVKQAAESAKKGEGFAVDLRAGKPTDTGFLVEVVPEKRVRLDHDVTPKDIQKFYNDNRQLFKEHPELRIGGYRNELNISAHTDDQAAATALAKKLDQRSVWDVKKGEEIPTGGQGQVTHFSGYPFENRMKDLRNE